MERQIPVRRRVAHVAHLRAVGLVIGLVFGRRRDPLLRRERVERGGDPLEAAVVLVRARVGNIRKVAYVKSLLADGDRLWGRVRQNRAHRAAGSAAAPCRASRSRG